MGGVPDGAWTGCVCCAGGRAGQWLVQRESGSSSRGWALPGARGHPEMLRPALCSLLPPPWLVRPCRCRAGPPRPDRPAALPAPQVDTTLFAEFQAWREAPTLDKNSPFLGRVYREDVGPCLDFTVQEVSGGWGAASRAQPLRPAALTAQPRPGLRSSGRWCGQPWRTTRSPSSPWLRTPRPWRRRPRLNTAAPSKPAASPTAA